jgi:hypothetical protein
MTKPRRCLVLPRDEASTGAVALYVAWWPLVDGHGHMLPENVIPEPIRLRERTYEAVEELETPTNALAVGAQCRNAYRDRT